MKGYVTHGGKLMFRATPSGLTGSKLVLENDGGSLGSLSLTSPGEVRLDGSDALGKIERALSGHVLRLSGTEVTATRHGLRYELKTGETVYEARLNPLSNSARAQGPDGRRIEVRGGLLRRGYEVVCEGERDGLLEVAVLLLYVTAALRRRAFRA